MIKKIAGRLDSYTVVFLLTLLVFAFFGYGRLGKASINNDAHFWYERTQNFMSAVQNREWGETLQNPKPGITVHWLSGISLETALMLYEKIYHFRPELFTHETFWVVHTATIGPLVTVSVLFVIAFFVFLTKLFNKQTAVYATILLAFQPFFVGLSRAYHADSVVAVFMVTSALCALYFTRQAKIKYIMLSGFFAGLAVLSKSAAVFILPYVGLVLLLDWWFERRPILLYIKAFLLWLVLSILTFVLIFPDMWIEPLQNLKEIFIYEGLYLATTGRDGVNGFLYYFEPIGRILTPFLLLSFVAGLIVVIACFRKYDKAQKKLILFVLGYLFFYFVQMSLVKQKMDRYMLPALPFMALVGGVGLTYLNNYFGRFLPKHLFLVGVFVLNLGFILYYYPNYLIFSSEDGKDQFGCSLCSDIGDYLNSKPNASDLKIISVSTKTHRIKPFVKGKVYTQHETLPDGWTPEYLVASTTETVPAKYSYCMLEKTISFRGTDYWHIYACKNSLPEPTDQNTYQSIITDANVQKIELENLTEDDISATAYILKKDDVWYEVIVAQLPEPPEGTIYQAWHTQEKEPPAPSIYRKDLLYYVDNGHSNGYVAQYSYMDLDYLTDYTGIVVTLEAVLDDTPEKYIFSGTVTKTQN